MNTVQNLILQAFIGELGLCSNSFHIIFCVSSFIFILIPNRLHRCYLSNFKLSSQQKLEYKTLEHGIRYKKNSHDSYF